MDRVAYDQGMTGETNDARDEPPLPTHGGRQPADGGRADEISDDRLGGDRVSGDLDELAERLNPTVIAAPPVQVPPVQELGVQELAESLGELAAMPANLVRPLSWLVAVAGFSLSGPALWLVASNIYQNTAGSALPVWACCLFLGTLILVGDATLLRLIPNRLMIRYACFTTAGGIAISAALLGALLISSQHGRLFSLLQLDSAAGSSLRITGGASVAWTFAMFNILTLVTYILGRVAYHQR